MSNAADPYGELDAFFVAMQSGTLDDNAAAALADRLVHDAGLRRAYLDQLELHGLLRWELGASMTTRAEPAEPIIAHANRSPGRRSLAYLAAGLAAAAVLGIATVTVLRTTRGVERSDREPTPVAILLEADAVSWLSEPLGEGDPMTAGPVEIDTGTLRLQSRDGTEIEVVGPARAELLGPARMRLVRGRLVADARPGFMVDADAFTVHDLGTRFEVSVNDRNGSRVAVAEGKVDVSIGSNVADERRTMRLSAGQGLWVAADHTGGPERPGIRPLGRHLSTRGALLNPAIAKPLDADADGKYGTDGGVYWNLSPLDSDAPGVAGRPVDEGRVRRLPPYIAAVEEAAGTWTARGFGYTEIDDPAEPVAGVLPRRVSSGVLAAKATDGQRRLTLCTIRIGDDPPAAGFRVGLLLDVADKPVLTPAAVAIERDGLGVEMTIAAESCGGDGDLYLFDVRDARPGDGLRVIVQPRSADRASVIGAVLFDTNPQRKHPKEPAP